MVKILYISDDLHSKLKCYAKKEKTLLQGITEKAVEFWLRKVCGNNGNGREKK